MEVGQRCADNLAQVRLGATKRDYDPTTTGEEIMWPFPTQLPPSKPGEPKFNPDNFEEAPL